MAVPGQVIRELPSLKWRDLTAPCEEASYDFSHTQAERGAYGIAAAWHDHTRRDPIKVKVRLAFMNTLRGGTRQYPDNWLKWKPALFDGSTGKLRHPDLGEFDARVEKGSVRVTSAQTAGVYVDIDFTETRVDVTKDTVFQAPSVDIKALAAQVGQDAGTFNIAFPSGILDRSLTDAIESFLGDLHAAQLTASGYALQIAGKLDSMIAAVERVTDPAVMPLYTNLVHMWDIMQTRAKQAEKIAGRSTRKTTALADTTLDAIAAETGNSVGELMDLNPALVARPTVPKGSIYSYYTDK